MRNSTNTEYRKIDRDQIRLLYVSNYYDGPLSGLVMYRDRVHAFNLRNDERDEFRSYWLYQLTDQEIEILLHAKDRFEELVGKHCSYDEHEQVLEESAHCERSEEFYEELKTYERVEVRPSDVIGWFVLDEENNNGTG